MITHSAQQSGGSPLEAMTDGQTYRNLLYLLARFPLGIAYFTVFVTAIAAGASLVPLLIGIPILASVIAIAGYVGVVEATLLRTLLGRDVSWSPADPNEVPLWPYLKQVATDSKNYILLLLAFASFATGNALFVVIVVWFAVALSLTAAPVLYWIDGAYNLSGSESIDFGIVLDANQLTIDTLPEALLVSLIGLVLLFVGLNLVNLTARTYAHVTESLLTSRRARQ